MKRLVDLYPRRWRERYGAELAEFVALHQRSFRAALDLLRGAIDAHLHPELVNRRSFSAVAANGSPVDDLVFVPRIGFRSTHALGTRANVVAENDGRTLTAAITPDRDGIGLHFTVTGIVMELGPSGQRFEDPVRIHDDHGRDISTPRPRWQVGGFLRRAPDGTATLGYTTLLPGEADVSIAGCETRLVVTRAGEHADNVRVDFIPRDPHAKRQLLYLENMVVPGGDTRGTIGMSVVQCVGQQPYIQLPDPTAKVHEVTLRGPVVMVRGPWSLEIPLAPA